MSMIRIAALALLTTAVASAAAPREGRRPARPRRQRSNSSASRCRCPMTRRRTPTRRVAAARARAIKANKRLLIDLGGNWCFDCRLLAGVMELPEMRGFVARHFEVVTVRTWAVSTRTCRWPARYGITSRLKGVPAVLDRRSQVEPPAQRRAETALSDARSLTPQALADWLARWVA